jgi:hypothetical protein
MPIFPSAAVYVNCVNAPRLDVICPEKKMLACSGNEAVLFCVAGCAVLVRVTEATTIADAGGNGASFNPPVVSVGSPMVVRPVSV